MAVDHSSTKAAVRAFWEAEACGERYGTEQERLRYSMEPEILTFADFQSGAGRRVLEIGVGMGADLVRWARAGAEVAGVDLTDRAVAITRQRLAEEGLVADLRVGDAEALPFDDASFDIVYSWGVLHHTPDTEQALAEAQRVLVPGGSLKVMLYHRRSWVAAAAWVRFCLLRGRPWRKLGAAVAQVESPGTHAFTRQEVRRILEGLGLDGVVVQTRLSHWDRKWAPGVSGLLGDRFGWFLLAQGTSSGG